jgi:hypothetical protein
MDLGCLAFLTSYALQLVSIHSIESYAFLTFTVSTFAILEDYFVNKNLPSERKVCGVRIISSTHHELNLTTFQTNEVLFPGRRTTTIFGQHLSGHIVALGSAMGLALISLVAGYMYGRRKSIMHAAYATSESSEKTDEERLGAFYPTTKQKEHMPVRL